MKKAVFLFSFIFISIFAKAQKIDSIYVHLYTDSLKKGTYNYINIDGKLDNGRYLPLDSTYLIFSASDGEFSGNSLWIPFDFAKDKVTISAVLRANTGLQKKFDVYIKKQPDPPLKTEEELLKDIKAKKRRSFKQF